jgi:hypothetical protein
MCEFGLTGHRAGADVDVSPGGADACVCAGCVWRRLCCLCAQVGAAVLVQAQVRRLAGICVIMEQDGLVPCGSYPAEADGRWRRTCYARVDLTGHRAGADVDVLPGGADA